MDTLKDKEFLADAEKAKLEINPVSGEEVETLVEEAYATPPAIANKAGRSPGRQEEIAHNTQPDIRNPRHKGQIGKWTRKSRTTPAGSPTSSSI